MFQNSVINRFLFNKDRRLFDPLHSSDSFPRLLNEPKWALKWTQILKFKASSDLKASELKMSVNKQSEMLSVGGFLEDFFVKKRRCREIGLAKMLR